MFCLFFLSLAASQSTNPRSPVDKVCISGSMSPSTDGTYEYFKWDTTTNGSIYYNSITNQYLYPWIFSPTNKDYLISPDPSNKESSSFCHSPSNKHIFNVDDCFNSYHGQWVYISHQHHNNIDTNLRLVNCNDICVSHSDNHEINGIYKWKEFDKTLRRSIYHCQQCILSDHPYLNVWLFGYNINHTRYWIIGTDYDYIQSSHQLSSCLLPNNQHPQYIFDLDDCNGWKTQTNHIFTDDINMIVEKCAGSPYFYNDTEYPTIDPTMEPVETATINDESQDIMFSEDMLRFMIITIITGLMFICCILCCCIFYKYRKMKRVKYEDKQKDNDGNRKLDKVEIPKLKERKVTPPGLGYMNIEHDNDGSVIYIKHNNYYYDEGAQKQVPLRYDDDDDSDDSDGMYDNINKIDNDKDKNIIINESDSSSEEMYDNQVPITSQRKQTGDV